MTLSKQDRETNLNEALELLLRFKSGRVDYAWFNSGLEQFSKILPTTWKALSDKGLVRRDKTSPLYHFTGSGWLEAMRVTGQISEDLLRDVGRVMACLKKHIDGRSEEAMVDSFRIAKEAEIPHDLLFNLIESDFICREFRRRGAHWVGAPGHVIGIPVDFGHPI